ncbi:MAG: ABC transporter substrate-binding protein [Bacteroidota bacterium]
MIKLIYSFFIILLLGSCGEQLEKQAVSDVNNIESNLTFDTTSIKYAQNFSVSYHEGYKIAHVHFQSIQREVQFDKKIILVPRGNPKPKLTEDLTDAWLVEVPIQTVAANDDGEITRITTLGLIDQIVAMGGGGIYDEELYKRWEAKQIASIGYSFHSLPLAENILVLDPDLLMLYAYDHQRLESLMKLRAFGINAIPQFAWAEPSFLGKAEWLKFTALFFNKEKEADTIFEKIESRCTELMDLVAEQSPKKKAFLVYHPSDNSDWNAHRNDFYASFLEAAGAENLLKDGGPTHAVGMNNEKLLSLAKDADYWIVNSTSDQNWPPTNYLQSFKAYQNQEVYHYQKRTRYEHNAYDWYETPEVRPDLVLEDLVSIFYPEVLPDHKLLFFEKVKLTRYD